MIARALGACLVAALVVSGCLIDEKKYDPSIPVPTGSGDQPLEGTCVAYCSAVLDNCTGSYKQYTDEAECMRLCRHMRGGESLADPEGTNTVACRLQYATSARSEQNFYCPSAGPAGGDRCGDRCEGFCDLREKVCSGVERAGDVDAEKCRNQCPALLDSVPFVINHTMMGDSLACRINHVINANVSPEAAVTHCWHTSIVPLVQGEEPTPCTEPLDTEGTCERHCQLVMISCTGERQVYESEDQCLAVCRTFPVGHVGDFGTNPDENTVGCRRYHSYVALTEDPDYHCTHAGPSGNGHCGDPMRSSCQSYCRILKYGCTEQFYASYLPDARVPDPASLPVNPATDELGTCEDECIQAMPAMPDPGLGGRRDDGYTLESAKTISDDDADRGDVFQCRIYHAVEALSDADGNPQPNLCDAAFGAAPCAP
jgi:hypothetical protein